MSNSFKSQVNITAFIISFNILIERKLVLLPSNQLSNIINSKVNCKKIIIIGADQLRSNNLRNIGKAAILEHFFNIFLALREFYNLQFFCLIIIAFQI